MINDPENRIFRIKNHVTFEKIALDTFRYQSSLNPVYKDFNEYLGLSGKLPSSLLKIPFLPAAFFKNHKIVTGRWTDGIIFESSGTSGSSVSRHYVKDQGLYRESFRRSFELFYGDPSGYFIAALLPSYTERSNSSLIYMMHDLISKSKHPFSGFYKENPEDLLTRIKVAKGKSQKILLMGVSFALLDLAENHADDLSGVIVMETGGMKGRRKEIIREELHSILAAGLNVKKIHSEYGMTELLSQAYSARDGIFFSPPWMKILIRDPQDPLTVTDERGITGGINIIDLANINSCSFIATDDLGRLHPDGSFEVLGRFDNSDVRGCNLMIE